MTEIDLDPLFGAEPQEIPLPSAPLVTVLCQVRFPEIISIQQKTFVAAFQERIRADYPIVRNEQIKTVAVNELGMTVADDGVWRFVDAERGWRLSLMSSSISLETRKYVSRADFINRFGNIIEAVHATIMPTHVTRLGVRYVDRVLLENGISMDEMLRPEMLGISGGSIRNGIEHMVSEVMCKVKEGKMLARWGILPAGGTHDPDAMPPVEKSSWFLDLDTFTDYQASPISFDSGMIRASAFELATRAYCFFRWAVTPQFLATFGGKID
jgi:uncharacterized protein (TIGR04255 family)